jgi:adenine-specific DNA glycosylase
MKWFRCGRNVFRVLSRYFDVETDIALASAKKVCSFGFRIDAKRQSCYFNQAIMEFGALQCLKVQIVVFACLTIVVLRCKKRK